MIGVFNLISWILAILFVLNNDDNWHSWDKSGKYGTCNAGAESVGVSDCNKVYKEAGNEAVMSISVDDCIDLDGMEHKCWGRWVWLDFDSMDQVESVKTSKALKKIFLEFKDVSYDFIPDERCVWIDLVSDGIQCLHEGEIRDDSVLYNDGCIKVIAWNKNLEERDAQVRDSEFISQAIFRFGVIMATLKNPTLLHNSP
ncbi:hypothetical protein Tco_0548111 [Tanacetum coccineum]